MTTTKIAPTGGITAAQRRVLSYVASRIERDGYGPVVREIEQHFGFKSTNGVMCHLHPLRRKGCVDWLDGCSRTLRVTELGYATLRGDA